MRQRREDVDPHVRHSVPKRRRKAAGRILLQHGLPAKGVLRANAQCLGGPYPRIVIRIRDVRQQSLQRPRCDAALDAQGIVELVAEYSQCVAAQHHIRILNLGGPLGFLSTICLQVPSLFSNLLDKLRALAPAEGLDDLKSIELWRIAPGLVQQDPAAAGGATRRDPEQLELNHDDSHDAGAGAASGSGRAVPAVSPVSSPSWIS
eukprot:scaffold576_cov260-Pinguiococcus_pyrenoidosus.AAC.94